MNFRRLQCFVKIVDVGSMTQAADLLHVAQPALSRQVRLLDVELRQNLLARNGLDTEIADIKNDASAWAQAGSVTAALFLQKFAPTTGAWAHLDVFAWNSRGRPGHPEGGEAQSLRAVYAMLRARYAG